MPKRMLCLLLAVLLLAGSAAAEALAVHEQLDEAVARLFERYEARGGVLVVGKNGEIVYQYAYGYMRRKPYEAVTMETQFRIASVSKMVTAIGVMQLVEQGRLDLDADISTYFGGTLRNPWYKDTAITLRMVMSHTSSLNPLGDYEDGVEPITEMLDISNKRNRNYYHYKPGTSYCYSNFNGGLLGSLVEAGSGQHVTTYMQQHVFGPLGAEGAYSVAALSDPTRAANTYNANGTVRDHAAALAKLSFVDECDPQHHYDMTTGSLWISGPDLCRVGMMLCNRGSLNGVRVLNRETVLKMESDQTGRGGITCTSPYGLNINRMDNLIDGEMIYGHQGISGAVLANLYYDPVQQLTFVLISNGCDNTLNDRIANFSRNAFKLCWETFWTDPDKLNTGSFMVMDDE